MVSCDRDDDFYDRDDDDDVRFVEYPEDTTWMEANLFDGDSSEHRWSIVTIILVITIVIITHPQDPLWRTGLYWSGDRLQKPTQPTQRGAKQDRVSVSSIATHFTPSCFWPHINIGGGIGEKQH